tara:strand:+ start:409 stop:510 length:102 start_codon:yes stop_codon:yes gene_type:complete
MKTLNDVKTFTFREFFEEDGNLIPIESETDIRY